MALKSQLGISRDSFDNMLTVFGSLLPGGHNLPRNMYESQKLLRALKMPYEQMDMANLYAYIQTMHAQMGGSLPPPPTLSRPAPATPQVTYFITVIHF